MAQVKLLAYLVIAVFGLTVVSADYEVDLGIKRSAICLIENVARHNNVSVKFGKVDQEVRNGTPKINCKLELGTEQYTGNSTSYKKAKEAVARQAYAKTKYAKPTLSNRTCVIATATIKSDISLLEEFGNAIGEFVHYDEIAGQATFKMNVSLNGKTAMGTGPRKQIAKTDAATRLIDAIGRTNVTNTLFQKYNRPKYHNMEPTERLRKIMRIKDLSADGVYTKLNELAENKGGKSVKVIVAQVDAQIASQGYKVAGTGPTFEEAKSKAAANLLRHLDFTVANYH